LQPPDASRGFNYIKMLGLCAARPSPRPRWGRSPARPVAGFKGEGKGFEKEKEDKKAGEKKRKEGDERKHAGNK